MTDVSTGLLRGSKTPPWHVGISGNCLRQPKSHNNAMTYLLQYGLETIRRTAADLSLCRVGVSSGAGI